MNPGGWRRSRAERRTHQHGGDLLDHVLVTVLPSEVVLLCDLDVLGLREEVFEFAREHFLLPAGVLGAAAPRPRTPGVLTRGGLLLPLKSYGRLFSGRTRH